MPASTAHIELPDRYRIDRHLANGGMASVWVAEDCMLGRMVAVKLLAPQFLDDVRARQRFQREARTAAGLSNHPNIVTIYDVGEHAGRPYIVMEFLEAGSLAQAQRGGRVARKEALEWLHQAAAGLDAAHERGVVHRDVKPANLLLDERRRLAIADFGIARLAYDDAITQTGVVLGTASYISPEQATGDRVTPASDRYSLAVVAFSLLAGERPFRADNFAAQARQHVEAEPPAASEVDPSLPPALDPVLRRGLAKDPERRPASAAALVEAIEEALGEKHPPPVAPTEPTRALPPRRPTPPAGPTPHSGRGPRRGLVLGALAALGLILAVVILASLGGDDDKRAERTPTRSEPARSQPPGGGAQGDAPAQAESAPTPQSSAAGGDPAALNDEAFGLMQQGRFSEAIPLLQRATQNCPVEQTSPCAYALFNLGRSLRQAGRPDEAIPVLERRLQNPNQRATVEQELAAARAAAGAGSTESAGGGGDGGRGKRKRREDGD